MSEAAVVAASVQHRSQDEVEEAIDGLTDEGIARLVAKGRVAAQGTGLDPDDLFSEAMTLMYAGKRPWRVDVTFDAHVTMVMRNLGSNRRRGKREVATADQELAALIDDERFAGETNAEEALMQAEAALTLTESVARCFDGDEVGYAVFLARAEGMSIEEVCDFAGIAASDYDTVYKRTKRKVAKAVATGAFQ